MPGWVGDQCQESPLCWARMQGETSGRSSRWVLTASLAPQRLAEAYVPPQVFYNGKVDYFDQQRLGGLLSHLRKTLKGEWRPAGSEQVGLSGWRL